MNNKMITPGQFIVCMNVVKNSPDKRVHITVSTNTTPSKIVALCGFAGTLDESESIANASLFAISKEMLETLIAIQESARMDILDPESIEKLISDVFAKLANEAGV
jgi:hypothetical protein